MKELERLGEVATKALEKALVGNVTLELKQRLTILLEKAKDASLPPETLRQLRAVEALEYIATADARRLLKTLGQGADEARLTKEARASLERLAK